MMRPVFFFAVLIAFSSLAQAQTLTAKKVIETLQLEKHVEGGYFRRSFEAAHRDKIVTERGPRFSMTSIYYLLSADSPIGHFHINTSDIIHYFHAGDPITYHVFTDKGEYRRVTLGSDIENGEVFQLVVPGGWWKASEISPNGAQGFALISEAVSPGFDYRDMRLGEYDDLVARFPLYDRLIKHLTRR